VKTNAARILDRLAIAYELREYAVDPDDLSAESVAQKVGLPEAQVLKTLLVRGDKRGPLFAVVPAGHELDLKALARAAGDKKVDTVPLKDVEPLTGYVRGGVTVLGAKKAFPVFFEEAAQGHATISVSAGVRGTQIFLAAADYVRATRATVAAISRPKAGG
jgi:Cys-tRNA(Pro)/Cys-tRNA(Cys) deacylase